MSDIKTFWFGELVDDVRLNKIGSNAQAADRALQSDCLPVGITQGMSVAALGTPNMTVNVTQGVAYDSTGQRIFIPSTQNVNIAVDSNGVSTATTVNSRIVSVFAKFKRNNQTPFIDGNSQPGFEDQLESFQLVVVSGAESGSPVGPALDPSMVLLADISIAHAQTTVTNGNIDLTSRRQDAYVISGTAFSTPRTIRRGRPDQALADLLGFYNSLVTGGVGADQIAATIVSYAGGGAWAGGSSPTNPATTVEAQFDKIVADLAALTSGASGAHRIGSDAIAGASGTIAAGTIFAALTALRSAANHDKAAGPAWADATTNPAALLSTYLDNMVTGLVSTAVASGARKIGFNAVGNFASSNVQAALAELVATTASNDGAKRIGFNASGNISSADVGAAIRELDAEKGGLATTNAWTGANTFDNITVSLANHYRLAAGTTVTRVQQVVWINAAGKVLFPDGGTFLSGQSGLLSGEVAQAPIRMPNGAQLSTMTVRLTPSAHGSVTGMTFPSIGLIKVHRSTYARTTVQTQSDSGTAGAYSTAHDLTLTITTGAGTAGAEIVDTTTYEYYAFFTGEFGTNSAAINAPSLTLTYAPSSLDEGCS